MASAYLYNKIDPLCSGMTPSFTVGDVPTMLRVVGLLPGQSVPLELLIRGQCATGPGCFVTTDHWGPLVRQGCPAALSADNTQYIEVMPGTYRLDLSGIPPAQPVAITMDQSPDMFDSFDKFIASSGCSTVNTCPPATPSGITPSWG